MGFPTPPKTWADGTVPTETDFNEQIRDALRYLKGLDGVPLIEDALELKDKDGTPVGNLRLKVIDEILQIRNAADAAFKKLKFDSCPVGTGATQVAQGDHGHTVLHDDQDEDYSTQGSNESRTTYYEEHSVPASGEIVLFTFTLTAAQASQVEAGMAGAFYTAGANYIKVQLYIDSVQQAETGFLPTTGYNLQTLIGNKAVAAGSRTVEVKATNAWGGGGVAVRHCAGVSAGVTKV